MNNREKNTKKRERVEDSGVYGTIKKDLALLFRVSED